MASIVQTKALGWSSVSVASMDVTFDSNVAAGNSIYVFAGSYANAWDYADDGDDYADIGLSSVSGYHVRGWYKDNHAGGATTVTVGRDTGTAGYRYMIAIEVADVDSAGSLLDFDLTGDLTSPAITDGIDNGGVAVTTTDVDQLILAACGNDSGAGGTLTAGTSFTLLGAYGGNGGGVEYRLAPTADDYIPTFTSSNGGWNWAQVTAVLKNASSGEITGTGSLVSGTSTVSGTGELEHTGTGSLTAELATISGTGSLTAEVEHTGTGALSAEVSTVSGTGGLAPTFSTNYFNPNPNKEGNSVAWYNSYVTFDPKGEAIVTFENIGDAPPDGITFDDSGSPVANMANFVGTLSDTSAGVYNIQVRATTEWGSADSEIFEWTILDVITGTGSLSAEVSTVSGTGEVSGQISGAGDLAAELSTISGTGTVESEAITGTGSLAAEVSSISGTGELEHTGTGALAAEVSTISATASVERKGTGALAAELSVIDGQGGVGTSGSGDLAAENATISGVGTVEHTSTGDLQAENSYVTGTGTVLTVHTGSGALQAEDSTIDGTGSLVFEGTGALEARLSTVFGYDDPSSVLIYKKGTITVSAPVAELSFTADGVVVNFVDTDYDIEYSYGYVIVDYLPTGVDVEVNYG